jgi:hypothetical protein
MARLFNGTNTNFSFSPNYAVPPACSMSCWFKLSATPSGSYASAVTHRDAGVTSYFQILPTSGLKVAYYALASGDVHVDPGSTTLTAGTWFHVAVTYDSVAGLKTYVNGASDGTAAANGALAAGTNAFMAVGYDPGDVTRYFPGSIADAAEWSVVLTASEIAALAKGARPSAVRPLSLTFYCPMDGLQSPEPDLSRNARNLTLSAANPNLAFGPPFTFFTPRWPQPLLPTISPFTLMPQIVT